MKSSTFAAGLLLLPAIAFAHHSFNAVFDGGRIVELEGEVVDVTWRNPHVRFLVRTSGDEVWDVETHSVSILSRMDIDAAIFDEGDRIRLAGNPARRGGNEIFGNNVLLPDGREAVLGPTGSPRWTNQVVGSAERWSMAEGDASNPEAGLFRTWSTVLQPGVWPLFPEDPNPALAHDYPLTGRARESLDSFDPLTDAPTLNCGPTGMPAIMNSPYPIEIVDEGETILFQMEQDDARRVVYLDSVSPEGRTPPSLYGYSVGAWEGDTLKVTTTGVNWGWFDTVGIPLSGDAEITEWFTPAADGSRLDYRMRIGDPATFTEAVELQRAWIWIPEAQVRPYECIA